MPPEHWAYKTQSKQKLLAWAHQVRSATTQQVEAIFKRDYEEQAFRAIRDVQHLSTTYGAQRLEAAAHRANALGMVGQRYLRSILKHKLESEALPDEALARMPIHQGK